MSITVVCGMVPMQVLLVTMQHPESISMHVVPCIQIELISDFVDVPPRAWNNMTIYTDNQDICELARHLHGLDPSGAPYLFSL